MEVGRGESSYVGSELRGDEFFVPCKNQELAGKTILLVFHYLPNKSQLGSESIFVSKE